MWFVFDIGNSSIKGGLFDGDRLVRTFVLPHDPEELAIGLDSELKVGRGQEVDDETASKAPLSGGRGTAFDASEESLRAGLASVVPASAERLAGLLGARGVDVTVVEHQMRLPFRLAYRTPETLGADRLAAATAAWMHFGRAGRRSVVALDAGTAFTCEVVEGTGTYLGGTIGPGPALLQRALTHETAQLPEVPLELPASPIGPSTREAIQSGVLYGFIETVKGLLRRIDEALGEEAFVVATGGWSRLLREHVEDVDAVDAHLVLRGIRILMALNR
jgi:type III pantothenate kinase